MEVADALAAPLVPGAKRRPGRPRVAASQQGSLAENHAVVAPPAKRRVRGMHSSYAEAGEEEEEEDTDATAAASSDTDAATPPTRPRARAARTAAAVAAAAAAMQYESDDDTAIVAHLSGSARKAAAAAATASSSSSAVASPPARMRHTNGGFTPRASGASAGAGLTAAALAAAHASDKWLADVAASLPRHADFMPGSLISLRLTNMRCHRNLVIDFHAPVNIITGKNGSGKSSILLAIRLALGCELPRREHGSAGHAAQHIMSNSVHEDAVVELAMYNDGSGCMDQAMFGRWLLIRRTWHEKADGKLVSTFDVYREGVRAARVDIARREFLERIRGQFNIFHDNPVMIMDQDTGKSFFQGTASAQYAFFAQATSLQRDFEGILDITSKLDSMDKAISDKQAMVDNLQEQIDVINTRLNDVRHVRVLKSKVADAAADERWAMVVAAQRAYEESAQRLERDFNADKLALLEKNIVQREVEARRKFELEKAAAEAEFERANAFEEEAAALQAAHAAAGADASAATEAAKNRTVVLVRANATLKHYEAELARVVAEQAESDVHRKRQQRLRRIEEAAASKAHAEAAIPPAREEAEACERAVAAAEASAQAAAGERDAAAGDVHDIERQLHALQSAASRGSTADALDVFLRGSSFAAKSMADTLHVIQRLTSSRSFRVPPIGPIARYIKVDHQWQRALESYAFITLTSFVVDNGSDAGVLEEHARGARYTRAARSTERVHESRLQRFPPGVVRLIDVMDVTDTWAFNVLLDATRMDKVVLANTVEEAERMLARGGPAEAAKCALLPDGRRVTMSSSGSTVRADGGSAGTQVMTGLRVADTRARERELAEELAGARAALASAKAVAEAAGGRHRQAQAARTKADAKVTLAERALTQAQRALADAEAVPEPEDDAQELVVRLTKAQADVERERPAVEAASAAAEEWSAKARAAMQVVAGIEAKIKGVLEKMRAVKSAAREKLGSAERVWNALLADNHEMRAKLNKKKDARTARAAELEHQRKAVEAAHAEAVAATGWQRARDETLSVEAARAALRSQKALLETEVRRSEHSADTITRWERELEELCKSHAGEVERMEEVKVNLARLKRQLRERQATFGRQRESVTEKVCGTFKLLMAEKNCEATLKLVHGDRKGSRLDGKVEIQAAFDAAQRGRLTDPRGARQETAGLSGGERSVCTNMLLAAIASLSPVPFRMQDEFDVFQDETTRRDTIATILSIVRAPRPDKRRLQMFLLTPHDMSAGIPPELLHSGEAVLNKLPDPVRPEDAR